MPQRGSIMTGRDIAEDRARRRAIKWAQLRDVVADYDRVLTVIAGSAQIARQKLDEGEVTRIGTHLDRVLDVAARGAEFSQKRLAVSRPAMPRKACRHGTERGPRASPRHPTTG